MKTDFKADEATFSKWREEWTRELAATAKEERLDLDVHLFLFRIGSEWHGIHPSFVEAVVSSPLVHRVPGRQGILAGMVNFRGKIIPCVHLSVLLKAGTQAERQPYTGILNFGGWFLAFPMAEAEGIHRFSSNEVFEPPSTISDSMAGHVKGMFSWGKKSIIWMDAEKLEQSLRKEVR